MTSRNLFYNLSYTHPHLRARAQTLGPLFHYTTTHARTPLGPLFPYTVGVGGCGGALSIHMSWFVYLVQMHVT